MIEQKRLLFDLLEGKCYNQLIYSGLKGVISSMDKNKRIKQAILLASVPGVLVFVAMAVLLKLVEMGIIKATIAMIIILVVSAILIGSIIKFLCGMMNSFSDVSGSIDKIANGDGVIEFKHQIKNEATRELLDHVKGMISEFARVVKGIKDATNHLGVVVSEFQDSFQEMSAMSENINSEANKIAENANNQARMTETFIDNIESLGGAIDTIAGQIEELTQSAENMKSCNHEADALMRDLVSISNENGEAVDNINKQTQATNHSVQEIMEAVDIITNIAGQTNLLALNASIEAARAGEQGRGFAVVAEEIGQLAVQSKNSSTRIAEIVNTLIQNSNESVEITKQLEVAFANQNQKIHETEEIFGRLNCEIANVGSAIIEIDKEAESAKTHADSMSGQVVVLKETVTGNTESVANTVAELHGFESIVGKCMTATETIADVSGELVGYVSDISTKCKTR